MPRNMTFDAEVEKLNRKKFEEMMRERMQSQPQNEDDQGRPIPLTDETFASEVARHPLMVVDFWASWCGPCRLVAPIIEELAGEYSGKVSFGKVNVDENPKTSESFGIQSIPTILVFKDGKPVDGVIGAVPKSQLVSKFLPYLKDRRDSPYR
jgi:thioredoxin 1